MLDIFRQYIKHMALYIILHEKKKYKYKIILKLNKIVWYYVYMQSKDII